MINHFRTLLLNRDGPRLIPDPGEEYVPPYRAVALSTALYSVRTRIFGADPDRSMLNYRLRQLLPIVHATPLEEYVLALDSRITYALDADDLVSPALYAPVVSKLSGTDADTLTILGLPTPPDATGKMDHSFRIEPTGSGTVRVTVEQPGTRSSIIPFTPGDLIPLPDVGYSFRLNTDNAGASWVVDTRNRPDAGPGEIVAGIDTAGEPVILSLFGAAPVEPYLTFLALWHEQDETPLRLTAALVALVYRTEERRLAGG